ERARAEIRVLAGPQDHLVPRHVDGTGRHADQLAVGVEAREVPPAQALERDLGGAAVAELLDQLVDEALVEDPALDELAPPLAADAVGDRRHGPDGRAAHPARVATLGGRFAT